MNHWPKIALAFLAVIILLGLGALFFYSPEEPPEEVSTPPAGVATSPADSPQLGPTPLSAQPFPTAAPLVSDDVISEIIADPTLEFPAIVNRLLQVLPSLDEEYQAEAAQHIANLSEDETAQTVWIPMLLNSRLPPPAAEVLFNDLLNRPHELSMPTLATLADQPDHALRSDAVEILEILYSEPPEGTTWAQWVKSQLEE